MTGELDQRVRLAAFQWLRAQMDVLGEVLPRSVLEQGFEFDGIRVPMLNPQGIFKPRILSEPISITTTPGGPYDDGVGEGGQIAYRYQGTDPNRWDNRALRRAMERRLPLVYFLGLVPGKYLATFPVYIVGDHPERLSFDVQVDDAMQLTRPPQALDAVSEDRAAIRREYVTSIVRRRLHQQAFRAG